MSRRFAVFAVDLELTRIRDVTSAFYADAKGKATDEVAGCV